MSTESTASVGENTISWTEREWGRMENLRHAWFHLVKLLRHFWWAISLPNKYRVRKVWGGRMYLRTEIRR